MIRPFLMLVVVAVTAGCSARLKVTKFDDGEPGGIVYRAPTPMVVMVERTSYTASGRLCKQDTVSETVMLPLGERFAVNVDGSSGWFASNALSVSFSDQGVLKQVTLNSDPQVDETLNATATLVREVAAAAGPALALAPSGPAPSAVPGAPAPEACGVLVKSRPLCVKTVEEWKSNPGC